MKIRVTEVAPLQCGLVVASIHAWFSMLAVPLILFLGLSPSGDEHAPVLVVLVLSAIFYIIFGFLTGLLGAFFYNVMADWLGGLPMEIQTETEAPPAPSPPAPDGRP